LKKREPIRMCVGCRQMNPKKSMIRIVRDSDRIVSVDRSGKKPGKGAYLCLKDECIGKARKTGSLSRALDCRVPEEIFVELDAYAK